MNGSSRIRPYPPRAMTIARRVGIGERRGQLGEPALVGAREIAVAREHAVVVANVVARAQHLEPGRERLARHRTRGGDDADGIAGRETRRADHFRRRRRRPPSPSSMVERCESVAGWTPSEPASRAGTHGHGHGRRPLFGAGGAAAAGAAAAGAAAATTRAGAAPPARALGPVAAARQRRAQRRGGAAAAGWAARAGRAGAGAGALRSAAAPKRTRMPAAAASADSTTSVTRACRSLSSILSAIGGADRQRLAEHDERPVVGLIANLRRPPHHHPSVSNLCSALHDRKFTPARGGSDRGFVRRG